MKTLTTRNIPDDLYQTLSRVASRNHRSIRQQVKILLERMQTLDCESPVARAASIRNCLAGRNLGNTVDEIRRERLR